MMETPAPQETSSTSGLDSAPDGPLEPVYSEFAGDADLAEILEEFVSGLDEHVSQMRDALAHGVHSELRRLAHQLKGAGGSYGYPQLTEAAAALESAAKDEDTEAATLKLGEMASLCAAIRAGLKASAE
jgi:HPt (histidine-containing phosphotransfer) domain-containing protein